jgi:hypothetical protein
MAIRGQAGRLVCRGAFDKPVTPLMCRPVGACAWPSGAEPGDSELDIPCSIFIIQTAHEKPISNTQQGMSKDEVLGFLSQRERAWERESAWLVQKTSESFHPHPASGHLLPEGEGIQPTTLGQAARVCPGGGAEDQHSTTLARMSQLPSQRGLRLALGYFSMSQMLR